MTDKEGTQTSQGSTAEKRLDKEENRVAKAEERLRANKAAMQWQVFIRAGNTTLV